MDNNDLKNVKRLIRRVLRIGKVVGINAELCKARVEFPDNAGIVSYEMPIIQAHTYKDKFYSMPVIDEYVLCAFLPNGTETGFILGSYYSTATPAPVTDANKFNITFDDGTVLEYDKSAHLLVADVKGSVDIKAAQDITVKAEGNISVTCVEAELTADKVTVKSPDITLGDGVATGVITQACICSLTGLAHPDASSVVKGVK